MQKLVDLQHVLMCLCTYVSRNGSFVARFSWIDKLCELVGWVWWRKIDPFLSLGWVSHMIECLATFYKITKFSSCLTWRVVKGLGVYVDTFLNDGHITTLLLMLLGQPIIMFFNLKWRYRVSLDFSSLSSLTFRSNVPIINVSIINVLTYY